MADRSDRARGFPSIPLLLAGLAASGLSALALLGVDLTALLSGDGAGWFLMIPAIVVGVLLLLIPGRSRRRRTD